MTLRVKLFEGIKTTSEDVANAAKAAGLRARARHEETIAKAAKKDANRYRRERDWALHCLLHKGQDRYGSLRYTVDKLNAAVSTANQAMCEAAACESMAAALGE